MAAVTFGHATRVIPLKIRARRVSLMSMHRENLKRRAKNTKPLSCWLIAEFYNNRWPVDILRLTEFQTGINFYMRKYLDKFFGYVTRTRTIYFCKYYETLIMQEYLNIFIWNLWELVLPLNDICFWKKINRDHRYHTDSLRFQVDVINRNRNWFLMTR